MTDRGGLEPGTLEGTEYGLNVGQLIRDHPDYVIMAAFNGYGYCARRKDSEGRGTGPRVIALTLDELAAKLARQEETP